MDWSLVFEFWVIALILTCTPGADWAYSIAAGIRAKSVGPSVLGIVFGYVVVVSVVAAGLGTVIARYPAALTGLTVAGSSYLIYLGLGSLLGKSEGLEASDKSLGDSATAQFFRGVGVSSMNPKGILLLIALLPQFATPDGWPSSVQMLVLGGLHVANITIAYFGIALLARRILRSRPRASIVITKFAGAAMTIIGAGLLIEKAIELF